jgi:hypothetical protein
MRRILVVANQTLGSEALLQHLHAVTASGPCRFHLAVPATPIGHQLTWSEGEAQVVAQHRLDEARRRFLREGFAVTGAVGDPSPMMTIVDCLRDSAYDEVVLSTLPIGVSKWVRLDLPSRVRRRFGVPVTHVVASPAPLPA